MSKNINVEVQSISESASNIQGYKEEIDIEMNNLIKIVDTLKSDAWIGKSAQAFFEKFNEFRNNWNGLTSLALNSFVNGLNQSANKIAETQQQMEHRIKTLGGEVGGKTMGISTSASGVLNGDYVDSNKLYEDAFYDPNTKFRGVDMDGNGTSDVYAIERDNTVIGYTDKDNVNTNVEALDVDVSQSVWDKAHEDYQSHKNSVKLQNDLTSSAILDDSRFKNSNNSVIQNSVSDNSVNQNQDVFKGLATENSIKADFSVEGILNAKNIDPSIKPYNNGGEGNNKVEIM